ncbi:MULTISPECIES: phosphosulfolactate synthase [unclassified Pseudofrankia]|uniref:phosphosulfolactate synthase n=1 Tax=unclassified Pseudofrankia TaxID=2994372 RepID=UPI0008DA3B00|nr:MULTISPECIES: phosphosulfolactate synthase [unclassified Pseudofrankia]MDT3438929.1 phosphosulfolactate synthase [Pseudofrankia sp. BMG5.37]OHV56936.1 phosphosulfolactate synthase [Pseudofrankia sp. BMG5.36]
MRETALRLPNRQVRPRARGLTMVIDNGLPTGHFQDAISSAAEFIDLVKFGWGTALVTSGLDRKIDVLRSLGIDYFFGGTLFEKHVLQDRFDDYRVFCKAHGCSHIEVSNGTIELPNHEKDAYIEKLTDDFVVLSEVGFKDGERSERLSPSRWVEFIRADLDAGADLVITEARESGRSGICRPDGRLRFGLIEDILDAGLPADQLLFEAPTKELQTYFVRRVGTNVNLGNIAPAEVLALETLRLGLRSDTLLDVETDLGPRAGRAAAGGGYA